MMKSTSSTNQNTPLEENMSNLTSASGEASVSNDNNNIIAGNIYPSQYNLPTSSPQPPKKKRNQPGHPDPEAEVIALSPRTLLATNRFVCDVCNKGFQRDQNLQLHRRGHNLPWKLKQRANKDVIKKKVYVCPETSCVHHDPSRALGDLTGIKKHFSRKHGEKKWKCEKCSKKYAVQSDWKAHSKTCGTREYRCDCGTLFSRRDSFITHRAFCDALAEESARSTVPNKTSIIPPSPSTHHINLQQLQSQFNMASNSNQELTFQIKKEHHQQNFPPWLTFQPPLTKLTPQPTQHIDLTTSSLVFQDFQLHNDTTHRLQHHHSSNPNPSSTTLGPTTLLPPFTQPPTPHISATALLQKAAQLGAKSSSTIGKNQSLLPSSQGGGVFIATTAQPHQNEVSASDSAHCGASTTAGKFGQNLSTFDQFVNGMTSYGNKAAAAAANITVAVSGNSATISPACETSNSLLHDMMMNNGNDDYGLSSTAFEDVAFGGILINNDNNNNNNHDHYHVLAKKEGENMHATLGNNHQQHHQFSGGRITNGGNKSGGHGNETSTDDGMMTRDFLGLRPLSESDMLSITGLSNCMSSDSDQINQVQKSWQGN